MTSTWADSWYWLQRGKVSAQLKISSGIVIVLGAPIFVPWISPRHSTQIAAAGCAVVLIYLFGSRHIMKTICVALGNATVCEAQHVATPFTSMFAALRRQQVENRQIVRVIIETGKFSNLFAYLTGDGKVFLSLIKENPDAAIHFYGLNDLTGDRDEIKEQLDRLGAPMIHFHDIKKLSKTHRNIVYVDDGRAYVWFEEHHEIMEGHHYIPHGAHLLQVDTSAAKKIEKDVAEGVLMPRWWQRAA